MYAAGRSVAGVAAAAREGKKETKYGVASTRAGYSFSPMVMETTGFIAPGFIALIKKAATHAAGTVDTMRSEHLPGQGALESPGGYAGRLYSRWLRTLSLARVRSVARRLVSASSRGGARSNIDTATTLAVNGLI